MPEATLREFPDHGEIGPPLDADASRAEVTLRGAEAAGIDLAALTAELEREGVHSFCDSYDQLITCIETKLSHPGLAGLEEQARRATSGAHSAARGALSTDEAICSSAFAARPRQLGRGRSGRTSC